MPLLSTGTALSQKIGFNSGFVTITQGGPRLVNLNNASVEISWTEKPLRVMNSVIKATHKRATFEVSLKGKITSLNKELIAIIMGTSSTDGSGLLYTPTDGQQSTLNPIFTAYIDDDTATPKVVQFQFSDAIITTNPLNATTEDYDTFDFEMKAVSVSIFEQNA